MVGLDGLQNRYPQDLSGGQKKRVGLARAIVLNPQVILYDEPTTGLDPIRADLINELILRMHKALGVTSVVVTHDLTSAKKVADRILMMHEGRFIVDTPPDKIDQVPDEVFARFVRGQADKREMAELEVGRPAADNDQPHTQHATDETAGRDQP
jgi:phospholipid/cholesterol/gamma-HCH transport system ATP-binding protein